MTMFTVPIFCVLFIFLYVWYFYTRKPNNFPPGPLPLPFIGNLHTIGACLHEALYELSKQYGPIVGIKFGPDNAVCLHGTKLIKEGLSHPSLAGRRHTEATKFISGDINGIANSVGDTWNEQRKFAFRNLREFGFGKSSMEELIMDEVRDFSNWLIKQNGKPVVLQDRFSLAVVNSLWKIVTGERFDHDNKKLHQILYELERSARDVLGFESKKNLFIFFYPKIGKLFPNWSGWNRLVESMKPRTAMFDRIIQEHSDTLAEKNNARDFVDVYLQEVAKTTDPDSSFNPKNGVESLKSVMADFFIAGTDTTSVTLSWLNLYLLHNPRVQKKLHEELDRVIGRSRAPSLTDKKSLPYTEAVLLETLRISGIASINVPHAATEDLMFHGYKIPKGTLIFANIWGNHHDPNIWGPDVEEFVPERFLSTDGATVQRNENLIPFSIGKRACLGESLARDTLFLFCANLAQNFEVCCQDGQPKPSLESQSGGLTISPISTTVVMRQR